MAPPANAQLLISMLDAVLIEWENVLVDTSSARRDALVRAFAEEGLRFDDSRWFAECHGRSLHGAVASALSHVGHADEPLADLLVMRAGRAFAERLGKGFVLQPGARAFVEQAQVGARIGIVTFATRIETEFVLRLAGLDGAFSTVVCAEAAEDARATYERALVHLAGRRPARNDRTVAVAHIAPAFRGARAAGIRTVAVGAPAHDALEADGAVGTIDGLTLTEIERLAGLTSPEQLP